MKCINCFKERVKYAGKWMACDCQWKRYRDGWDKIWSELEINNEKFKQDLLKGTHELDKAEQ